MFRQWLHGSRRKNSCTKANEIGTIYCIFSPSWKTVAVRNGKLCGLYGTQHRRLHSCDCILNTLRSRRSFRWSHSGRLGDNRKLDSVLSSQCLLYEEIEETPWIELHKLPWAMLIIILYLLVDVPSQVLRAANRYHRAQDNGQMGEKGSLHIAAEWTNVGT